MVEAVVRAARTARAGSGPAGFALTAVAIALIATAAPAADQSSSGTRESACGAEVIRAKGRHALRFVVRFCDRRYAFGELVVDPSLRVTAAQRRLRIDFRTPDESYECRVVEGGKKIRCNGQVKGRAVVRGRFSVAGPRCLTDTRFHSTGRYDCEADERCPPVSIDFAQRDREPGGCP